MAVRRIPAAGLTRHFTPVRREHAIRIPGFRSVRSPSVKHLRILYYTCCPGSILVEARHDLFRAVCRDSAVFVDLFLKGVSQVADAASEELENHSASALARRSSAARSVP